MCLSVPDVAVGRQLTGTRLAERRRRRSQPCTCLSRCQSPTQRFHPPPSCLSYNSCSPVWKICQKINPVNVHVLPNVMRQTRSTLESANLRNDRWSHKILTTGFLSRSDKISAKTSLIRSGSLPKSNGVLLIRHLTPAKISSKFVYGFFSYPAHKHTKGRPKCPWMS